MRPRRSWLAAIVGCLLAIGVAAPVFAHPQIVAVEPAASAQLTTAPQLARIAFDQPIEAAFASLTLYDERASSVASGGARDPADATALLLALPPLAPGVYTAVWRAVGSDGHRVRGSWSFTLLGEVTPAPQSAAPAPPQPVPSPAQLDAPPQSAPETLARAALIAGALGAAAWPPWLLWVLGASPAWAAASRRSRWLTAACALLALLGAAAALLASGDIAAAMTTRSGTLLAVCALSAALLALLAIAGWAWLALLPAAALLGALALGGHAAGAAAGAQLASVGHALAAAVWVGGLLQLAATLPAAADIADEDRTAALRRLFERFSGAALASVALLLLTGAVAAMRELRAPAELVTTPWGRALGLKLAIVTSMLALGAYHRRRVGPQLATLIAGDAALAWLRRFRRSSGAEAALAIGVVLATASLTQTPPPQRAVAAPLAATVVAATALPVIAATAPAAPFDETQRADDLAVRLTLPPPTIGDTTAIIAVSDAQGRPLDVQRVRLTVAAEAMDMGTTQLVARSLGDGRYQVDALPLTMVDTWIVDVLVRRVDADDVTVQFRVPVGMP